MIFGGPYIVLYKEGWPGLDASGFRLDIFFASLYTNQNSRFTKLRPC